MTADIKPLRVLIVDDSFEDREILKRYLKTIEEYDCQVEEAKNADAAFEKIMAVPPPDLLFLDFNMPGSTGLELLQRIRRSNNRFNFPVIMLTGEGSENVAVQAMKTGVGDYLVKDEINPESIRVAVISTIERFMMEKTIEEQRRQLEVAARTDGLTGLWNRRYFDEQLEIEIERASRYGLVLSLVMADLDHFKKVNDLYGHLVGDSVLIGFSEVLKQGLRMSDFAARYGGEEFCIIMPNIDLEGSAKAICRLADQLRKKTFRNDRGESFLVTASYGVVMFSKKFETPLQLIEAADGALYHAKNNGRNQAALLEQDSSYSTKCLE